MLTKDFRCLYLEINRIKLSKSLIQLSNDIMLKMLEFINKRTGKPFFTEDLEKRRHTNQNFYILEKLKNQSKKEDSQETNK